MNEFKQMEESPVKDLRWRHHVSLHCLWNTQDLAQPAPPAVALDFLLSVHELHAIPVPDEYPAAKRRAETGLQGVLLFHQAYPMSFLNFSHSFP